MLVEATKAIKAILLNSKLSISVCEWDKFPDELN